MRIRNGDTVLVTAGKDKGKTGPVTRQLVKQNRVVVEGVNVVTRHVRPRPGVRQSGKVQQEAPIHISNVALYNSKIDKGERVGFKILYDGRKVRIFKSSGEIV